MVFDSRTEVTRDDWQTPKYIAESLGKFDLDPCASCDNPTRLAYRAFTIKDDGLSQDWQGRVWLNPPYGSEAKIWVAKLMKHGNGIALMPPRMGSIWFQEIVLSNADALFFIKRRVAFINPETGEKAAGNNADSVLVAFGKDNAIALQNCGIEGKLWNLESEKPNE